MSEAAPEVKGGPPPLAAQPADALAPGARLAEFEIRSVLGAGGFGIVYLAWDHALEREVALKEYMPATLAGRAPDGRVTVRVASQVDTFSLGLRSFVNEARLLARFDHPSLVKVYRFWEDNGTAYMAMPMVNGRTLRQVRQAMPPGSPGEAWCRALLEPLLGALECMHREEIFHRDIAPDNILLTDAGVPVLLDFGAARRVIGDRSHAITAIVKPNFAPIEQYADVAAVRQGPWTDLYALAATMYYLLTGQPPLPAAARALHDELLPLARLQPADCSLPFLQALDWALAVRPKDRPQSLALWRDVLEGRMAVPRLMRQDVTWPNVSAVDLQAPRDGVADFDPTQPAPASAAVGGAPAAMPGATLTRAPGPPRGATAEFEDTLPQTLPPPAPTRHRRPWPMLAGAAILLLLVALLAWRAASTPAVQPALAVVDPGASAAPTASAASAAQAQGQARAQAEPAPAAPAAASAATETPSPATAQPREVILPPVPGRVAAVTASTAGPQAPAVGAGAGAVGSSEGAASARPTKSTRERERDRERPRERERDETPVRQAAISAPSERCADKNFLLRPMCIKKACDTDSRLRGHAECVRMQQAEQERRDIMLTR